MASGTSHGVAAASSPFIADIDGTARADLSYIAEKLDASCGSAGASERHVDSRGLYANNRDDRVTKESLVGRPHPNACSALKNALDLTFDPRSSDSIPRRHTRTTRHPRPQFDSRRISRLREIGAVKLGLFAGGESRALATTMGEAA